MATIDYKEKYEQALERAKYYHDRDNIQFLENIFPELAESEDERIKKELSEFLKIFYELGLNGNYSKWAKADCANWIAWIEKQSKDSPVLPNSSNIGKSVWSEEDDDNMIMIEDRLSDYFDYIREDSTLSKNQKKSLKEEIIRNVNWLKSLKDRVQPQPKQEWSEEDERICHSLIIDLSNAQTDDEDVQRELNREINWLKSLRPQSQWKPSEEQIEALDFAVDCIVWEEFCIKRKVLKGLLEQLKKL